MAYENGGDFDSLFKSIINGLYNREVKYQLGSTYPRTREEIKLHLVRIVAAERRAYEHGYSRSESKDGLWHTTVLDVPKHNHRLDEEPMDISAMQSVITSMEDELLAASDGKKLDKSDANDLDTLLSSVKVVNQITNIRCIFQLNVEERPTENQKSSHTHVTTVTSKVTVRKIAGRKRDI